MIAPEIVNLFGLFIMLGTLWCKRYSFCWFVGYIAHLAQQAALLRISIAHRAVVLRNPTGWNWIGVLTAIDIFQELVFYRGHEKASALLTILTSALFMYLFFFGGRGIGRKLANKIKSMSLTAVNEASFKREQASAFA
jgi:hypothetical protein